MDPHDPYEAERIHKAYEAFLTYAVVPNHSALAVRVDGRAFSAFSKHLAKLPGGTRWGPFDGRFIAAMDAAAEELTRQLGPAVVYAQSDEITLLWAPQSRSAKFPFSGHLMKLSSVCAGIATAAFVAHVLAEPSLGRQVGLPHFDGRAWPVPDMATALSIIDWRRSDARRNSVSMWARHFLSHQAIEGRPTAQLRTTMAELGHPWEDLPATIREGRFFHRAERLVELTPAELEAIPERYRPTGPVSRSAIVQSAEMPPLPTGCTKR